MTESAIAVFGMTAKSPTNNPIIKPNENFFINVTPFEFIVGNMGIEGCRSRGIFAEGNRMRYLLLMTNQRGHTMATRKTVKNKGESDPQVLLTPEVEDLVSLLPILKDLCEVVIELRELADMSRDLDEMEKWWRYRNNPEQISDDVFLPEIKMLMPDILRVIHAWKVGLFQPPVPQSGIIIKKFVGPDERKTVRVYPDVWEQWKKFCELYPAYNEKDLMGTALVEFMDKYSPASECSSVEEEYLPEE
jgi:hypothetical protein